MSAEYTYDYAIVRVVPRVERGEQMNVGVILSCPDLDFLDARIELDESRLLALDPHVDLDLMRANLATIPAVCRRRGRRRPDWRAAAARPLPVARIAAQHDDSDVSRPHWPNERSWRLSGAAARHVVRVSG